MPMWPKESSGLISSLYIDWQVSIEEQYLLETISCYSNSLFRVNSDSVFVKWSPPEEVQRQKLALHCWFLKEDWFLYGLLMDHNWCLDKASLGIPLLGDFYCLSSRSKSPSTISSQCGLSIKTSNLIFSAHEMTGFYIEYIEATFYRIGL